MLTDIIHKLKTDIFWRNNLIFFVGSMIVAGLNYLFYPILGRLMNLEAFGETQALISMFLQTGILLSAFSLVVANVVTNKSQNNQKLKIIRELEKLAFIIVFIVVIIAACLSVPIQHFLNFDSPLPFILLLISVLISVPIAFRNAYLQGKLDFLGMSLGGIIVALGKILFSVVFVLLGFKTFGVMGGIICAQVITLVYLIHRVSRHGWIFGLNRANIHLPKIAPVKTELIYGGLVFFVNFITILLFSSDILVIKHYFDPTTAGLFAGVAAIGRISFFASMSVAGVLFPSVKLDESSKHNKGIFIRSAVITLAISLPILALFALFPSQIINLMVGSRYLPEADLLPRLALSAFLVSLVNLLFYYHLALRRVFSVIIALLGIIFTIILILLFHNSLVQVINDFIYGNILILLMLVIWSLSGRFNRHI